jgi:hypothetical protein
VNGCDAVIASPSFAGPGTDTANSAEGPGAPFGLVRYQCPALVIVDLAET